MALIKVKTRGTEDVTGAGKNLIINGGMQVAQRSTSAVQAGNGTYDTVDRMMTWSVAGGGTFTGSQSTGHQLATGHDTAFKINVTGADTSIAAGDYYEFLQRIEAKNLQHLRWGTASAKKLQVSFWVRATKTGVQSLFVSKQGTGTDYRNVLNYTINVANTWEHKTIEVPALTASTIANDASTYVQVGWILAMGSSFQSGTAGTWTTNSFYTTANTVNHMDSTSNEFYVTGFQVEVGDTASDFEHRSFAEELQLCRRYFQKFNYSSNTAEATTSNSTPVNCCFNNTVAYGGCLLPVEMRTSGTFSASAANTWVFYTASTAYTPSLFTAYEMSPHSWGMRYETSGTWGAGNAVYGRPTTTSSYWQVDAEL